MNRTTALRRNPISAARVLRRVWIETSWVLIYQAVFFTALCWFMAMYTPDEPIRAVELWRMAVESGACLALALFAWAAGLPFRIQYWTFREPTP